MISMNAVSQNWPYLLISIGMIAGGAVAALMLISRLGSEIKLNRKIEQLSGHVVREEATAILKRINDTRTQDTILRILPTLANTQRALRQTGLKIDIVGYVAAILLGSATIALLWNNPAIPETLNAAEPIVTAVGLHFLLSMAVIGPIARRRKATLLQQLSQVISHVSRSLQAGQTIDSAIGLAAKAIPNPLQRELHEAVKLSSVGVAAADALRAIAPNIDLPEFDFFISAIEAADRSGGNLSRVLNELVNVIRARHQLKLKIDAMTAEGKMSAYVLSFLPVALFGYLAYSNPDYVDPLLNRDVGQIILGLAFGLIAVGMVVMLRMVRLKV